MTYSTSPYDHAHMLERHGRRIGELEGVIEAQGNLIQLLVDQQFPDGLPDPQEVEDAPEGPSEANGEIRGEMTEPVEPVDPPAEFDPSEHTAEEVIAYLTGLGPDGKTEGERVLALEKAGKNRSTIVGK